MRDEVAQAGDPESHILQVEEAEPRAWLVSPDPAPGWRPCRVAVGGR